MASEQTLKAVKLARGQEISAENQKKQSAQENHKGVFKVYKVAREFQKEKKNKQTCQLSLMLFRVVKQCQKQKYFLDFEQYEGFIYMWQLQSLMTSVRASPVKW